MYILDLHLHRSAAATSSDNKSGNPSATADYGSELDLLIDLTGTIVLSFCRKLINRLRKIFHLIVGIKLFDIIYSS